MQDRRPILKDKQTSYISRIYSERKKVRKYTIQINTKYYVGIYLTKEEKVSTMKINTLNREVTEDTMGRKALPCSRLGRTNIMKTAILPKLIYSSMGRLSLF